MNDADSKKWEEIKGYRQDVGDTTDDEFWWIDSKLAEQDQEIERLQGIERIAQQLVNEWNEFEEPIALEWDMPDPMRTIHEWACEWYSRAEKAETRVAELEANRSPVTVLADTLKARVKKELEPEEEKG